VDQYKSRILSCEPNRAEGTVNHSPRHRLGFCKKLYCRPERTAK